MSKIWIAILAVLFLGAGIWIGRESLPKSPPQTSVPDDVLERANKYTALQNKFSDLAEIDFDEFLRLKTLEEKYRKADEILGKILLIVLADLGLKLSPEKVAFAKNATEPKQAPSLQPVPNVTTRLAPTPTVAPAIASSGINSPWVQAEARLKNLKNDQDIDAFLKAAKIPDLMFALRQSKHPTTLDETMKSVNGRFEGEVIHNNGTGRRFHMVLSATLRQGKEGLRGRSDVELWENGKRISRATDRGDVQAFRQFPSGSETLILKASPVHYFQLYHLADQDEFIGNYYEKAKNDETTFDLKGTVRLQRR